MRAALKQTFNLAQRQAARLRMRLHPGNSEAHTRLTIFALHSIAKASSDMAVTESRLREQLAALLASGYRCLDLPSILQAVAARAPLPQPAFCLTFDDGYRSLYDCGWKILEDLDLTATVFVTVNFIETRVRPPWHSQDVALLREYSVNSEQFRSLTWPQLRELAASRRFRIGSHSMNHFMTGNLPEDQLGTEVRDSKFALEDRLSIPIADWAYPYGVRRYGAYSDRSEAAVRDAGYQCSLTSEIGRAGIGSGPWLLPRIPLTDSDSALDARAKAAGAYDWVALAQQSFQRIFPNPHNPQ